MKILALVDLSEPPPKPLSADALAEELHGAWQLYSEGFIRAAYATSLPTRVVFELEATDETVAREVLARLPLVADGTFEVTCIELRPFANWSRLFGVRDPSH